MRYVNMNEVAFDANAIAFPGLGNCHGVVYQTNGGLFALHIYGADHSTQNKAPFFGDFVRRHRVGAGAVGQRLYGFCPKNRYVGGNAAQKAELQVCATALGFTGPIHGAMWDTGQLQWGTTYVECTLAGGVVQARIENFTGQPTASVGNAAHLDHKIIAVVQPPGFGSQPMVSGSLTPPATVINAVTRMPGTPSVIIASSQL